MFEKILNGDDFSGDNHNVQRPTMEINMDNIDDIMKECNIKTRIGTMR